MYRPDPNNATPSDNGWPCVHCGDRFDEDDLNEAQECKEHAGTIRRPCSECGTREGDPTVCEPCRDADDVSWCGWDGDTEVLVRYRPTDNGPVFHRVEDAESGDRLWGLTEEDVSVERDASALVGEDVIADFRRDEAKDRKAEGARCA